MRPVIIGAGHNGLVAAAYLARAGRKPLVLEKRREVGGCAVTHEIYPGFRAPALAHAGVVRDDIARDLGLEQQGLHIVRPDHSRVAMRSRRFRVAEDDSVAAHLRDRHPSLRVRWGKGA